LREKGKSPLHVLVREHVRENEGTPPCCIWLCTNVPCLLAGSNVCIYQCGTKLAGQPRLPAWQSLFLSRTLRVTIYGRCDLTGREYRLFQCNWRHRPGVYLFGRASGVSPKSSTSVEPLQLQLFFSLCVESVV
jgi:hypothetical protein